MEKADVKYRSQAPWCRGVPENARRARAQSQQESCSEETLCGTSCPGHCACGNSHLISRHQLWPPRCEKGGDRQAAKVDWKVDTLPCDVT